MGVPGAGPEPAGHTVVGMLSAWLFVSLAGLAALACAVGAYRVARGPAVRRPKGVRR